MLMPKKFKLKKKVANKKDTPSHHSYKVVRCIRAWFVPSLSPSSPNQLRIKGLTFFISEQWGMKTRTQKLLKPVSQGQPLCLEILTLMFSILARYQRMYNFTSMQKWRTVHKHTRRLRMQMQTWVYRNKLWKRWENYWALAVVHSCCACKESNKLTFCRQTWGLRR